MTDTLLSRYDALVCDLDGVVYRGQQEVPYAADSLNAARSAGAGIVFATNNASRTPADVSDHLVSLKVDTNPEEVLTSSMVGAQVLGEALAKGAKVLAIGGPGVAVALEAGGLSHVTPKEHAAGRVVAGVLQGYGASVTAGDLAEAAYAIQAGAHWVATNTDRTLPTDRGVAPGNGTLVEAVQTTVDVKPEVVGKPGPLMYQLAATRLGSDAGRTLGIGDRIETDIAGAHAAHMDALHVLTGVHRLADLVAAPNDLRPRFVARDLRALDEPYDEPVDEGGGHWRADGVRGALVGEEESARVELVSDAQPGEGDVEMAQIRIALRVLWQAVDTRQLSVAQAVAAMSATH
ncbi:HAD-IIA family hydrolase [Leekyejoonella antrihumi]|uniref:HAD-IIA family hydrolase n=1 Tax=Leekyejoonella antrihumi TaxID=1660198 RepID=A0A563DZ14_9MICO|nr:HAD-IIA family hydrolase [Leekyejoonella antrihumi]TWP34894.1 HAD-IIA family hydrolase [Leekyejoonella antrihumi]